CSCAGSCIAGPDGPGPSSVFGPKKRTSPVPSFSATVPLVSNHTRHGPVPSGAAPTMPYPVTPNAFATRNRYTSSTAGLVTAKAVASQGCPGRFSTSIEICTRSKNGFGCSAGRCGISRVDVGATVAVMVVTDGAGTPIAEGVGLDACDEQAMTTKTNAIAVRRGIGGIIRSRAAAVIRDARP